ncbi:Acg family FMN-binding oxidoreductase [Nocardia bovistercoris]|uniref:NAD(P)H nitroreductase n=1 Tax=Nocardia bovistercoris TaxID=2785916 RepID=A0A931N6T3_9NOCA|nr:hypothetical protein [Nocardia bovistercoris]MBH0781072.1 hypothetical protein [Nocardia bovistercoris]
MTDSDLSLVPDRPTMLAAMQAAGRAPSVHNTQPWRWVLDGAGLRLYRDDRRLLDVADPAGRQLVISCGAMLHHARTAFAAAGWHTDTVRIPDPGRPEWLATIEFRRWSTPPAQIVARAEAIMRRRTERLPMREPERWEELEHRLRALARYPDVVFDVLDDSARPRLAVASEQSAAVQRYDMQYQSELHWWTAHSKPSEGIPREALAAGRDAANTPIRRTFPTVRHPPERADHPDRAELVVLSTHGDSTAQWLAVGEALSAVLLECTVSGAASCALTHLTELPAARRLIAELIDHQIIPQVVIRIGADDSASSPRTPRRAVEEFLTLDETPDRIR